MKIKSLRIFIKYLRKFLAGFVSVVPLVRINYNPYPLAKAEQAIATDWQSIGEDLTLAINKNKPNERQK